MSKVTTRTALIQKLKELKKEGLQIGYTSGAFDILHRGHVEYLQEAKKHVDILIVGVNSDVSIQEYKSPLRPICHEADRVLVLSGLESVDYVFVFSETNNNRNIELLQPDLYIKAGDYKPEQLSSAKIVEGYGGQVLIVPFIEGRSTSGIIDKVLTSFSLSKSTALAIDPPEKKPAIFIDRDGTLNKHVEYLHEPEKFELLDGVINGLKKLQEAGYRLVVVTNQAGIGLGYFSKEDFYRVNKELFKKLGPEGINIDKIYFSPYSKADKSPCRKPATGMVDRAVNELNLDLEASYVIGDTTTDMQLAANIGCPGILVETGFAGTDAVYEIEPFAKVANIAEAADLIISR